MRKIYSFLLFMLALVIPIALQAQTYLSENFENVSNALPNGWVSVGPGTVAVYNDAEYAHSGNKSIRFSDATSNVVALPALSVPTNTVQVRLWTRSEGYPYCLTFDVGYVTDITDASSFVAITTIDASDYLDTYKELTVYMSSAPADARIAFRHQPYSGMYYWFCDDVTVEDIPSCPPVTNLTAFNYAVNHFMLTWTDNTNGNATYTIYNMDDNSVLASGITTNYHYIFQLAPPQLSGLNPGTVYNFGVAAQCSPSDISPIRTVSKQSALSVAEGVPYNTGFEPGQDVSWMFANNQNAWCIGNATNNGGNRALYISNDSGQSNAYDESNTSVSYAYKTLYLTSTAYTISYDWKGNGESNYDYLRVFLVPSSVVINAGSDNGISTTGAPNGWIALDGGSKLNSQTTWQHVQQTFTPNLAGGYYLLFCWQNDNTNFSGGQPPVAIDNVSISASSGSCLIQFPYTEGFESVTATAYNSEGNLPACWNAHSYGSSSGNSHVVSGSHCYTHEGTQSLALTCGGSGDTVQYVFMPPIQLPWDENEPLHSYKRLTLSFWMYTENNTDGTLEVGYVFNDVIDDNTATFSYSYLASEIPASSETVYSGTEGLQPAGTGKYVTISLNSLPAKAHRLAFRWRNTGGTSSTCCIDDITIMLEDEGTCDPKTIPYSENFEVGSASSIGGSSSSFTYVISAIPKCWDVTHTTHITNGYLMYEMPHVVYKTGTTTFPIHGNRGLIISQSTNNANYVLMPTMARPLNELQITFWMGTTSSSGSTLMLGYVTDDDISTFNPVVGYPATAMTEATGTTTSCTGGQTFTVDLSSLPSTATRLVFKAEGYTVYIDDIVVEESNGGGNPGSCTQTIPYYENFESNGNYNCWSLYNADSGTGRTDGSESASPLNGTGLFVFHFSTNPPQYLISPELAGTGNGLEVSFSYAAKSNSWPESFKLGYSTTTNDINAFVWGTEVTNITNETYERYTENMQASGIKYVAIQYTADDMFSLYIDSLVIMELAACQAITQLTVDNVSPTSVSLSWNGNASSYTVMNGANQVATGITNTNYTVGGLTEATNYTFTVIANCSATETSYPVSVNVSTACGTPHTLPYTYGFEDASEMVCWTVINESSTNNAPGIDTSAAMTGSYGFRFSSEATADDYDQYLISPQLISSSDVEVEFNYRGFSTYSSYAETFVVGYSTTTSNLESFTWGTTITALGQTWNSYNETFPAGTKYVAIHYTSDWKYYLDIDNFSFNGSGSTPPPCTQTIPYYEGFESYDAVEYFGSSLENLPPLPTCWEGTITSDVCIDPSCSGNPINYRPHVVTNSTGVVSVCWSGGNQSLEMVAAAHSSTYALLPPMNTPLSQLQLMFWMGTNYYATGASSLTVGYVTSDDASTFVPLQSFPATEATLAGFLSYSGYNPQGKNIMISLSNVPASATRLAFKWENNADVPQVKEHYPLCFIDDISITSLNSTNVEYMTACEPYYWNQTGMTYNTSGVYKAGDILYLTINHAVGKDTTVCIPNGTFTWHGVEYAASGDYTYIGYDDVTGCDLTDTLHLTIGNCCPPKTLPYYTSFEEVSGVTYSGSTNPSYPMPMPECWLVATTAPASAMVSVPHVMVANTGGAVLWKSGVNSLAMCQNGDNYAYALLPEIIVPLNNLRLKFWMGTLSPYGGTLTVGYVTNDDYSTFTALHDYPSTTGTLANIVSLAEPCVGGSDVVLDLTNVPYEATRLAFRWNSSFSCFIDDISVDFPNIYDCLPAQDIQAIDVQLDQITLRWVDPNGGASYTVSHDGNVDATGLTAGADGYVTCTISSLSQDTHYTFNVRATCSNGNFSDIASIVVPTSICEVLTDLQTTAGTNHIDISWVDPNGGTSYTVLQFTDDPNNYVVNLATGIQADASGNALYTIYNLNPNTIYYFAVVGSCYNNLMDTFVVVASTLECSMIETLPYTQDFESGIPCVLPTPALNVFMDCMTRHYSVSSDHSWSHGDPYVDISYYAHSGTQVLTWTMLTMDEYEMMVLPELNTNLYPINTLHLSFWCKYATYRGTISPFVIGVMTDPNDVSTFEPVSEIMVNVPDGGSDEWYHVGANLSAYTGTGRYIAIRVSGVNEIWSAMMDDIKLEEYANLPSEITVTPNNPAMGGASGSSIGNNIIFFNAHPNTGSHFVYWVAPDGTVLSTDEAFYYIDTTGMAGDIMAVFAADSCVAVTDLMVSDVWSDQVDVQWSDPVGGTVYTLLQATTVANTSYEVIDSNIVAGSDGNVSYTIQNLAPGTSYSFAVRGICPDNQMDTVEFTAITAASAVQYELLCNQTSSYTWHGVDYPDAGGYESRNDSLYLYILTGDTAATACDSFDWYEHVGLTTSGNYTHTFTTATGCDSVVTLHLTVNQSTHNVYDTTVCESYEWHGMTYTNSDTYTYEYTNATGCVSVDTLHLTVNHGTHNVNDTIVCESYEWHGMTYTNSDTYTYEYTNATGCVSVDTLHLTVNHGTHNVYDTTVCESFEWHGMTYTNSDTYTYEYTNATGCVSVDTLHLTINHGTYNVYDTTVCEIFEWHGMTYTNSDTYTYEYTNVTGCVSVDTLHLTVNHGTHNVYDTTVCEIFEWHGMTYTNSDTYTYEYTNATGCVSVDTLHLTVNHGTHNVYDTTVCESYEWHGMTYTNSDTYTYEYTNATGCVSVDTLRLTINHGTHNVYDTTVCESYEWHGMTYTNSDTYTYEYTNATGCVSVDTLHLTIINCCSPVENLVVDGVSDTTVSLSWTGSAAYYTVINGTAQVATNITDTHYTVSGLTASTNYIFSIIANCSATSSSVPVSISATTSEAELTVNITVVPNDTAMSLYVLGSGSYHVGDTAVLAAVANEGFYFVNWEYNNAVLSADNPFFMVVTGDVSGTIYAIFDTTNCEPVVNLHYSDTTSTSVNLVWDDPNNNGATYAVGYFDGDNVTIVETGITITNYNVTGLTPNTTYYFVVRTDCSESGMVYSDVLVVTTPSQNSIASFDESSKWVLYPNPTTDRINVQFASNNEQMNNVEIQLYDMYGKWLNTWKITGENTEIDLSSYASSVYFIKVVEGQRMLGVRKIVKQ